MAITRNVGARIKRREDPRLITGTSTYTDDIKLQGMLHMAVLRSVYAHARIRNIDASKALALPGVQAVLTAADLPTVSLPNAGGIPDLKSPAHNPLAPGKANHQGEAIAVVIADDRFIARDALDLIEVDYEPLPAVVDAEKAAEKGSPTIHDDIGTNVAYNWVLSSGDVDAAFNEADVKVSQRIVQQRLIPNAIEGRAVLADYQPVTGNLTVWSSTQIPHLLRTNIAALLGLPEQKVRVIAPEVGGAFGSKVDVYAEELITVLASMKVGKPVKWVEDRTENFLATIHGRDQIAYCEAAAKADGTITGLRYKVFQDFGAYLQLFTPVIPTLTGLMLPGCYKIPAVHCDVTAVFTNKTPYDAYRGAGRPEATFYIERLMDILAQKMHKDPTELRRKNFIPADAFPYQTSAGLTYDSGNYEPALNRAMQMADYWKFREQQLEERAEGRYLGIGVSSYVEVCGMGPSAGMPGPGWESCQIRMSATGKVTVLTGTSPHGQGHETTFAQMAADELGVPYDDVVVVHGDTDALVYGIGTFGSRATAVGGAALMMSVDKIKEKAKTIAAHLLEARPEDMEYSEGRMYVKGNPEKGSSIQEVAFAAFRAANLPPGTEPGLEAFSIFDPTNFVFPFGTHIAIVEVDVGTGEVKPLRYVAVDDCGKQINPLLVDGQIHGGIAQGMSQALYEEAVYDESGQLLSGSFMDYALPTATMLPSFELDSTETPTTVNPMGVKGIGEAGTIGSTPATVNAVIDALSPFGVTHIDMPLRPEKIWRAIQAAGAGR